MVTVTSTVTCQMKASKLRRRFVGPWSVCVYYTHIRIHIHTHTHSHTRTRTHTNTHFVCVCVCVYVCVCMCVRSVCVWIL